MPRAATSPRVLVAALTTASLLQWTGAASVLPLLPLFLRDRGTPDALVGVVMAAYFAGAVVAQLVAGRVGDRLGHRPVLVAGLAGYAVASALFLLEPGAVGYAVLRAAQGAMAGTAQVAMLALVARAVRPTLRGRAFAAVYGGELAGVAIGPLVGTTVGVARMPVLFVVSALGAAAAALPVLAARVDAPPAREPGRRARLVLTRGLAGVLVVASIEGVLVGMYETAWSLLLASRGASNAQIGASWSLYALPFVLVAPIGGWLADHADRRVLVVWGSLLSTLMAATYPFVPSVTVLIALGALEAAGVAVVNPAVQSLLSQVVPAEAMGAGMGAFAGLQTACTAASAVLTGVLFGIGRPVPFLASAAYAGVFALVLPFVWRGVQGRAAGALVAPAAPMTEIV